jgi:hypothetical protein
VLSNISTVSTGCVGHTSVHSDSGSRAWGSGAMRCACARYVEQQQLKRIFATVQRFAEGDLLVTSRCFPTLSSWRTRVRASGELGTSKMVGRA